MSIGDARQAHGGTIAETHEHTNERGVANSSARLIPANTVCLSRTASVGYVVITAVPMATSQDFVNFVCTEAISPRFLQLLFLAEGEDLLRFATGSVHQTIYFPEAKAFYICVPSRQDQERIGGLLDEALMRIAAAKIKAEQNLRNARALFESYLHSVFTRRSAGWKVIALGELAEVFDGPHATPRTVNEGPVFLGISALEDGAINLRETRHVSARDFVKWTRRVRPQAEDVVFSYETRLGQAAIIPPGLECCLGRRMGLIRPSRTKLDPKYLVYQYISPPFREYLRSRTVHGATVDRLSLKEFSSFPIQLPGNLAEQQRIANNCETVREHTRQLESLYRQKLVALDELKKSILHQAFTGQL